ncbi:MAG: NAD-dependent epimerase/dehydratase family protein [Lachnospiraceae bacterium]|nr:NAD-dependent epimerase/dehydratase family protein [Lachnospiraceae bacterium]
MRKILVTGGTVFVSRYVAEYFVGKGDEVYVLNRNHYAQPDGTILIEADRHNLGDVLQQYAFDTVLDVTAYTGDDISYLLDALGYFEDYVLISSSAVYPETLPQPFTEGQQTGSNKYWGAYGSNKIDAERELQKRVPDAYMLRPPYLYGPMNNVYREAFVFECADQKRKFYLPRKGDMKLQFFHVRDLCRCMEAILDKHPANHIFNVGNEQSISVRDWVEQCYRAAGRTAEYVEVYQDINQREYFSFSDYEYQLDVSRQRELIETTIPFEEGLKESYLWYSDHKDEVRRKGYIEYIDKMSQLFSSCRASSTLV